MSEIDDDNGRHGLDYYHCRNNVGIDIGTVNLMATVLKNGLPMVMGNDTDSGTIPAMFMYNSEEDRNVIGRECNLYNPHSNPEIIKYVKNAIRADPDGERITVESGGRTFTLKDILRCQMEYMISFCKQKIRESGEFLNDDIGTLVITAPIGMDSDGGMGSAQYRDILKNMAMELTELPPERIRIMDEPLAAAIAHYKNYPPESEGKNRTVVFDLGGGTLDITCSDFDTETLDLEVVCKMGDLHLGGKDWDERLANLMNEKYGLSEPESEAERSNRMSDIIELKERLSTRNVAAVVMDTPEGGVTMTCSKEEFEASSTDLTDRAIGLLKQVVDASGGFEAIDRIVLVGGGSNMPMIMDGICRMEGLDSRKVVRDRPSQAVAMGAAYYAGMVEDRTDSCTERYNVTDIVPYPIMVDSIHNGEDGWLYTVIPAGTRYEDGKVTIRSSPFIPHNTNQKIVSFTTYEANVSPTQPQSESDEECKWIKENGECKPVGLEISVDVPKELYSTNRSREFVVVPEICIDESGIISISIYDGDGNKLNEKETKYVH